MDAGDRHSLVRKDGTVWAWGFNRFGELGDGTTDDRRSPVQVVGLTDAVAVAAGLYHSLALRKDGTVWAWGSKGDGELGDGSAGGFRNSPVQVVGLTDAVAVAASRFVHHFVDQAHSLALGKDGTVWAWGSNADGKLGNGTSCPGTTGIPPSRWWGSRTPWRWPRDMRTASPSGAGPAWRTCA